MTTSGWRRGPAVDSRWVIGLVAALAVGFYGTVGFLRYLTYHSPAYDLGFFDQVTEQTASGAAFHSTFVNYSFLGQHWEPILAVFALLDRLAPTPLWLSAIQALALGLAPVAAWRLARVWLPDWRWAGVVAALATALSPMIARGVDFDFHAESLTPVIALLALDAAARGQRLRCLALATLLFFVKEDALLAVVGIGWIAWRVDGRLWGVGMSATAALAFVVVVGVVMPHLRGGATGDLIERYGYLGDGQTVGDIARGMVLHPSRWISQLLSDGPAWALALIPLALLPLLSGWAFLGALMPLMISLLSRDSGQSGLLYHYGLESFPLLLACALIGLRRLRQMVAAIDARGRLRWAPGALFALATAVGYVMAAPLPGGVSFNVGEFQGLERRAGIQSVLDRVPVNAEVAASTGLVAHVSNRAAVWEFPSGFGSCFVVLDAYGPVSTQSLDLGYDRQKSALSSRGYRQVASAEGVTLYELC